MNVVKWNLLIGLGFVMQGLGLWAETEYDLSRVVSIGGTVTETVYALGMGEHLVAVDQSSTYPPEALEALPDVGYIRTINAEGVLSMTPTLILTTEALGPEVAEQQLKRSGVPMIQTDKIVDLASLYSAIELIADALGEREAGAAVIETIKEKVGEARNLQRENAKPQVAFLMNHNGMVMAAGHDTKGHGILTLAGGENLFAEFKGYKPVSEEALLAVQPDVVLVASMGGAADTKSAEVLKAAGLDSLAAVPSVRAYNLDMGYFMSFGPRTGQAVLDLTQMLYPEE